MARGNTNIDAFVLAQPRHTHTILPGCHSILGSHAAQECFLQPLHEANTSAVPHQGLQELCPALTTPKFHPSHRRRNEGNKNLCRLMEENAEVLSVREAAAYAPSGLLPRGFLVGIMA